jgi:hypothetical protein
MELDELHIPHLDARASAASPARSRGRVGGTTEMLSEYCDRSCFSPWELVSTAAPAAARSSGGYEGCGVSISTKPASIVRTKDW